MSQVEVTQQISAASQKVTCLYCRVSTLDQASGLEAQIRTLKEYCDKNRITQYEIFTDEGISGAKQNRPSLDRMMALVKEGRVNRVVCYSFSRYARSVTHLLSALETFRSLDVAFVSYTESIDTNSPMGRAFFVVVAAISQLERELIVERVKNGLKNAKMKGIHIGRKKTRPSELLRTLIHKGLPYRTIAAICGTSQGSVWAEKKSMRIEEEEARIKKVASDAAALSEEIESAKKDPGAISAPAISFSIT